MTARFLAGTLDSVEVRTEQTKAQEALAPVYAEMAKLPILNGDLVVQDGKGAGSSLAFLASDQKCAEQFQQALSMEGLGKRQRIADLVTYKCGSLIKTPVRLEKLSLATVESIMDKAIYVRVTIADVPELSVAGINLPGESKGRSGWVPLSWLTNY
jgi:hypothetical protein